jgi:hypothetical protein
MIDFHYGSPLKAFIQGMIREKQALGYKYQSSARVLVTATPKARIFAAVLCLR